MNRAITAKIIAAQLGISQPTVSRALSGEYQHLVAPETRLKIQERARELGYRPNAPARFLRQRRTGIVGFYAGEGYVNRHDDFRTEILTGLQIACYENRFDLLLHSVHQERSPEDIFGELLDGRIDGLFIHTGLDDPLVPLLATSKLPAIALADALPGLPSVSGADTDGMTQLMQRLWDRGHRQFGFVGQERRITSVDARREAFEQFLRERDRVPMVCRSVYPFEDFDEMLEGFLKSPDPPTVICCWNDRYAYGLLRACRTHGIQVPGNLAITGFDGFLDTKFPAAQLTTVTIPWRTIAEEACQLLLAKIDGKMIPSDTVLPVALHGGDTD